MSAGGHPRPPPLPSTMGPDAHPPLTLATGPSRVTTLCAGRRGVQRVGAPHPSAQLQESTARPPQQAPPCPDLAYPSCTQNFLPVLTQISTFAGN